MKQAKTAADILLSPVMSEKSLQGENRSQYTFFVANDATKVDVKRAIKEVYDVMPARVRMINTDGKQVRFGRYMGRRASNKKAIVILPQGKQIAIHEGV